MATLLGSLATRLADAFCASRSVSMAPLPRSAEAALVLAMRQKLGRPVVWILDGPQSLEQAHQDILTLSGNSDPDLTYYPAWESLPGGDAPADPEITGHRLDVLIRLSDEGNRKTIASPPAVIVTCIQALLQKAVQKQTLIGSTLHLRVGQDAELDGATALLAKTGYDFSAEVITKGQAAVKGGLLDVWPVTGAWPVRIEFNGSTVESIRFFNPADQKSVERISTVTIPPANEWALIDAASASLLSYMPDNVILLWSNNDNIAEHASIYEQAVTEAGAGNVNTPFSVFLDSVTKLKHANELTITTAVDSADQVLLTCDIRQSENLPSMRRDALQPDIIEETRRRFFSQLAAEAAAGHKVIIIFDTKGSLDHFKPGLAPAIKTGTGILSGGFSSDEMKVTLVAESDLYGRRKLPGRRYDPSGTRGRPDSLIGERITDLTSIEPGDYVVHTEHGIGRYLGMREIMFNGAVQEVLTVEYADQAKLQVPASQAHLLSRYVGFSRRHVELHRLTGKRWGTERAAAEIAIRDLAATLLETQAKRNLLAGHVFPPDLPWQKEFEAAFPFRETPDQTRVIAEIKKDMESARPMDRLVCGDAGYGKTEMAMRAAFKAAMGGKQVAVLVPTTVLAQQHYETFTERMSAYPIRIEMLSRFCGKIRQTETLQGLASGGVDIVIGTHSLLQSGIRFKDLGLVVVDEEQRFGVAHKERLKQLRELVDVLTMTATPIPRTLYLSMTGARDMSLLQTPPRERLAVETIAARNTDPVVREAVMRELNREGQVFYLHNRVMTIDRVATRLRHLVPEARIQIAHGQMAASELAAVMQDFRNGRFNVLVSTTIIESGTDIPRANTILIDRADRFGIADLYQLRGRVGRSTHKAYAYLLLPPTGPIEYDARERINTLKGHSHLGAGFSLALRDLEIRGSGNLLGSAQSGHITAIGFELYCQLLKRTVAQLKGETPPPVIDVVVKLDFLSLYANAASPESSAAIPYSYIEDERLRISCYRKLAEAASAQELSSLRDEFTDRFGPMPPPVHRLMRIVELRILASQNGIRQIETQEGKVLLTGSTDLLMQGTRLPRLKGVTPDERLDHLIDLVRTSKHWKR